MNYYAIHVKTGSEITVARRIDSLNRKMNGLLLNKVIVPFSLKTTIDPSKGQAYQQKSLLFNSYIFIQLDELTTEVYCVLREISSSVFKIIVEPINENEMNFLAAGEVTEFVVEISDSIVFKKMQSLFKEIITAKKNQIKMAFMNNSSLHINLPTNLAKKMIKRNGFTVFDITRQPILLIKEVLKLYELETN